jgi:hypothetical protein
MYGRANHSMMGSFRQDPSVTQQKLKPGTVRRIKTKTQNVAKERIK